MTIAVLINISILAVFFQYHPKEKTVGTIPQQADRFGILIYSKIESV